jgi:uncharacterized cofD-like protein
VGHLGRERPGRKLSPARRPDRECWPAGARAERRGPGPALALVAPARRPRVALLGGGHGLAAVLRALSDFEGDVTAVVNVADDGGSSGGLRNRFGGPAPGDLRRCLTAVLDDADLRAALLEHRADLHGGLHPVGNLLLLAIADSIGDLGRATLELGRLLGARARVLPATVDSVSLAADVDGARVVGESAVGRARGKISKLEIIPHDPPAHPDALSAIEHADWTLLGPGSLFTSVLAVCCIPQIRSALKRSRGSVVWVCNLAAQEGETSGMRGLDHLRVLKDHGVRVDAALYDPDGQLGLDPRRLRRMAVQPLPAPLSGAGGKTHDELLLGHALRGVFTGARSEAR